MELCPNRGCLVRARYTDSALLSLFSESESHIQTPAPYHFLKILVKKSESM